MEVTDTLKEEKATQSKERSLRRGQQEGDVNEGSYTNT